MDTPANRRVFSRPSPERPPNSTQSGGRRPLNRSHGGDGAAAVRVRRRRCTSAAPPRSRVQSRASVRVSARKIPAACSSPNRRTGSQSWSAVDAQRSAALRPRNLRKPRSSCVCLPQHHSRRTPGLVAWRGLRGSPLTELRAHEVRRRLRGRCRSLARSLTWAVIKTSPDRRRARGLQGGSAGYPGRPPGRGREDRSAVLLPRAGGAAG